VQLPYSYPRLKQLESKSNGHQLPDANQVRYLLTGMHVMTTQRVLTILMELRFNYKIHGLQLLDVPLDRFLQIGMHVMTTQRVLIILMVPKFN